MLLRQSIGGRAPLPIILMFGKKGSLIAVIIGEKSLPATERPDQPICLVRGKSWSTGYITENIVFEPEWQIVLVGRLPKIRCKVPVFSQAYMYLIVFFNFIVGGDLPINSWKKMPETK